jgi:hypothetical protein
VVYGADGAYTYDVMYCCMEPATAHLVVQAELLKELDAAAMDFAAKQKQAMRMHIALPPMYFFYQLKKLTLVGYYTSEIGFSQELGKTIIPPRHAGCAPLQERAR